MKMQNECSIVFHTENNNCDCDCGLHRPLQAAGGTPMQIRYWKVSMQARKQQYLGQISAMAFLLRLYMTAIRAKAWSME